ncbi:MAG: hypothetical protein A2Y00_09470 [Omnitrophica WOR_2 bacterium GWF2_43_52]|nr:MAG: hypothetical protein A2062_00310 [Omnitrophica WOR_2 bacterium GWA2_44_7]OGX13987.1 MAG: hypothetical protein A2Y01_01660 [Omnitrophica WOR_2 bacterium GWC2_44_8]OGX21056.1 MAG: hypothetical protein A2Y00_09470 [Omnitrophica WOR_2 bacterium GWF2_43_52]OGX54478.1 MAG: hypothetical protein A2321_00820 [Omnitrophica WOR_2 bacterium RIFOXYB2_FULL_45_11]HAH20280.1 hypothetical protein [Candidatus Omnitrophota bacterium]
MKLSKKALGVFISAFFLLGCLKSETSNKHYNIKHVIDGDTVELENGQSVRYLGIDTPEIRKREGEKWVYAPDAYAEEAKEFNRKLVESKTVRLEFDVQKKDKYDRWLAYCFVGDIFVNAKMLEDGYALLYTSPPNIKYADILVKMQEEARKNNRGLWAEISVIAPKEAKHYLNKIVTVEGKVTSVRQSPKVTILNFGQSKFKAVVFKDDFSAFMAGGVSLKAYKGKTVKITGKVKEYKDNFEIIVRHPSAIEIVG